MASIIILLGLLSLAFVLVWIFGEDPTKQYIKEQTHDKNR